LPLAGCAKPGSRSSRPSESVAPDSQSKAPLILLKECESDGTSQLQGSGFQMDSARIVAGKNSIEEAIDAHGGWPMK
jgi:hypothetical protein